MRLHTNLGAGGVYGAMQRAKASGRVAPDVEFTSRSLHRSRTHENAFEIQLGTYDRNSLPPGYRDQHGKVMHVRKFRNSGDSGAAPGGHEAWAATWHEWGWFMLELFKADPSARWGSEKGWGYKSLDDFHAKTQNRFLEEKEDAGRACALRTGK